MADSKITPWKILDSEAGPDLPLFSTRLDRVENPRNGMRMNAVIIESEEMAGIFRAAVDDALKKKTWELFLNEDDKLRWRGYQDGREVIYVNEPESTWFQRFVAGIIQLLPVKSQL